ncbi:unnamed protein product, partial [Coregonus sp. 'balchen']
MCWNQPPDWRPLGSKGSVVSVEIREDHHRRAVNCWYSSWSLQRGEEWPDNVPFHTADLLPPFGFAHCDTTYPSRSSVCCLPSQVIDLVEGLRCAVLPLLCERFIKKDGRFCRRKAPIAARTQEKGENDKSDDEEKEYMSSPEPAPFGSVPYIAQPHPEKASHT